MATEQVSAGQVERTIGERTSPVFMAVRGEGPVRLISYFGLGAADQSSPNKYKTVKNIQSAILGPDHPGAVAFGIYNTAPLTAEEARGVKAGNFLEHPIAAAFVDSLGSVERENAILTVESYSGAAFFALLAAALARPGDPRSEKFISGLNDGISKVLVLAPAMVAGNYGGSGVDILDKFAMGESQPVWQSVAAWAYLWNESYKLASVGHLLDHSVRKIHESYLSRARHLRIFKTVFLEAVDQISSVPRLPEIVVVQHRNDKNVPHLGNKPYLDRLQELKVVSRQVLVDLPCQDPHCLYFGENDDSGRLLLREIVSAAS